MEVSTEASPVTESDSNSEADPGDPYDGSADEEVTHQPPKVDQRQKDGRWRSFGNFKKQANSEYLQIS